MANDHEIPQEDLDAFFADMDGETQRVGEGLQSLLGEALVQIEDRTSQVGISSARLMNKVNGPTEDALDKLREDTRKLGEKLNVGVNSSIDSLSERVNQCVSKAHQCKATGGKFHKPETVAESLAKDVIDKLCPIESEISNEEEQQTGDGTPEVSQPQQSSARPAGESDGCSSLPDGGQGGAIDSDTQLQNGTPSKPNVIEVIRRKPGEAKADCPEAASDRPDGENLDSGDGDSRFEPSSNIVIPEPLIQVADSGQTGLISLCRPDLWTAPEIAKGWLGKFNSTVLGGGGKKGTLGNLIGGALSVSGLGKVPLVGPALNNVANNLSGIGDNVVKSVGSAIGCGPIGASLMGLTAGRDFLSSYITPKLNEYTLPLDYARRLACPTEFPTAEEATAAYLSNAISGQVYNSWLAINNKCPEPWAAITESRRTKLIPSELVDLRLRGIIGKSEFNRGLRSVGYTEQADWDKIWAMAEAIPSVSDIVRFMVRDVEREDLVKRFGMDSDFNRNFKGQLADWASSQGVSKDFMRSVWRAHWSIPDPSALFRMLHRLPEIGGFGDYDTVLKDVETALKQQDILPFWIPRLIAINEVPITRRDIYRGLQTGAIKDGDVASLFRQLGHSFRDSKVLADSLIRRRVDSLRNSFTIRLWRSESITADQVRQRFAEIGVDESTADKVISENEGLLRNTRPVKFYERGFITNEQAKNELLRLGVRRKTIDKWLAEADLQRSHTPVSDEYDAGLIERRDATSRMQAAGMPLQAVNRILDEADTKFKKQAALRCAAAVRKRFLTGDLEREATINALTHSGLARARAIEYVDSWSCEQAAMGKVAPTSAVTKWFKAGIITLDDAMSRLRKLGWDSDDVNNIITAAANEIAGDNAKALRDITRKAKAAIDGGKREVEKAAKAAATKSAARVRAAERKERSRIRLAKELTKASERATKAGIGDVDVSKAVLDREYRKLMAEDGLSQDEAMQAIVLGSESKDYSTAGELLTRIRGVRDSILSIE